MSDYSGMTKIMAFMFFLSSTVTALTVGLMTFTFVTGDLPFDIQPMLHDDGSNPEVEELIRPKNEYRQFRAGESYAMKIFKALEKEREQVSAEKEKLAVQKELIEELSHNTESLQKKLEKSQETIMNLLDQVDEQEKANVIQLAGLVSNADVKSAAQMLLDMSEDLSAKVIYNMESKKSAEIISSMLKVAPPEQKERAARILEYVHRLGDKLEI